MEHNYHLPSPHNLFHHAWVIRVDFEAFSCFIPYQIMIEQQRRFKYSIEGLLHFHIQYHTSLSLSADHFTVELGINLNHELCQFYSQCHVNLWVFRVHGSVQKSLGTYIVTTFLPKNASLEFMNTLSVATVVKRYPLFFVCVVVHMHMICPCCIHSFFLSFLSFGLASEVPKLTHYGMV